MSTLPDWCHGLIDDAATFPPGNAPLEEAMAAHLTRREQPHADLVGPFVVRDSDLPRVADFPDPLALVVTGGAGQIAGPLGLAAGNGLRINHVEIALRDPEDLPGNARRVVAAVDAARAAGSIADEAPVYVELPPYPVDGHHLWLAAADEVAAAGLRLKFRTGGMEDHMFPSPGSMARMIDIALDRETPFKCTAGLHRALRHTDPHTGYDHHGFLNVLIATLAAFDGAGSGEVVNVLEDRSPKVPDDAELGRGRRWFRSFGSCSVEEPLTDLREMGLLR